MAGMKCVCGNTMSTVVSPNETELIIFTQKEWEEITEGTKHGLNVFDIEPRQAVWRCRACSRLYFFEDNKVVKRYVLEE
ncbi:hypothetical protein Back11_01260 [Paenibacillus baekrokdamisoli]|uniref:Uncharacterized protein n=1 Tax=Paenibacillus baekrokdamisoli TaxID=1712516 RepID=A0A3G9IYT0_9BACL|nr:hypothetical protein [Paenibacillus baekrokdamisoli]MBB3069246.1 hypothetical protein [Paenibacillus baekrokdamisoli]BBH18781.1 hypothetical protein Back11_01260 [Paenibacillus baekrokdamisoli]